MNRFTFLMTALVTIFAHTASANSLQLKASDGTIIDVGYRVEQNRRGVGLGSITSDDLKDLAIHLSNSGSNSNVVLTVNSAYSLSCSQDGDGWFHINSNCRFEAGSTAYYNQYRDTYLNLFLTESGHGLYQKNTFKLSVVRDGYWLEDSVPKGPFSPLKATEFLLHL